MAKFSEIISSDTPVLVDFSAEWCGPCKMMAPILKDVAEELRGKVRILKIDVDKNREVAEHFQIQGVPTLMIFKNSQQLWRQSGVMQAKDLIDLLKKYI